MRHGHLAYHLAARSGGRRSRRRSRGTRGVHRARAAAVLLHRTRPARPARRAVPGHTFQPVLRAGRPLGAVSVDPEPAQHLSSSCRCRPGLLLLRARGSSLARPPERSSCQCPPPGQLSAQFCLRLRPVVRSRERTLHSVLRGSAGTARTRGSGSTRLDDPGLPVRGAGPQVSGCGRAPAPTERGSRRRTRHRRQPCLSQATADIQQLSSPDGRPSLPVSRHGALPGRGQRPVLRPGRSGRRSPRQGLRAPPVLRR